MTEERRQTGIVAYIDLDEVDWKPIVYRTPMQQAVRHARKLIVLVVGITVIIGGIIMLVIPGPGILGILAGLGILAAEFTWARHLLKRAKEGAEEMKNLYESPRKAHEFKLMMGRFRNTIASSWRRKEPKQDFVILHDRGSTEGT